jgi:hypothetical protein
MKFIFLLALVGVATAATASRGHYINDVEEITFRRGWAIVRDGLVVSARPRMTYVHTLNAPNVQLPTKITCTNPKYMGFGMAWPCHADLPDGVMLRWTKITCDGLPDADYDPARIFVDTCYIEYALMTDEQPASHPSAPVDDQATAAPPGQTDAPAHDDTCDMWLADMLLRGVLPAFALMFWSFLWCFTSCALS